MSQSTHTELKELIKKYCEKDETFRDLIGLFSSYENIYIVGGFLRDLLLGEDVRDIDFLYEGNLEAFLKEISSLLNADYKYNKRFMTGTMKIGKRVFDFASTRCEKYPKPGVLPVVRPCPLESDFVRRDFTVNALVWDIKNEKIIDFFNGLQDVKLRILRITYENSFIDDPTRMIRGVRFASKYSLDMDKETVKCYNTSLKKKSLSTVSPERLRRELDFVVMERSFNKAVSLMDDLRFFNCSSGKIDYVSLRGDKRTVFNRHFLIARCLGDYDIERVYPKDTRKIKEMLSYGEGRFFEIYRKFGETDLLLYLLWKGMLSTVAMSVIEKMRDLNAMKIGKILYETCKSSNESGFMGMLNKIANLYLRGELKDKNDIRTYIISMEVDNGKPNS